MGHDLPLQLHLQALERVHLEWNREGFLHVLLIVHYVVTEVGFKYNMTDLNAAIGLHQLRRVDDGWRQREEIWNVYTLAFTDLPLALPAKARPQDRHGHHLYTLLVDPHHCGMGREEFIEGLDSRGVGVGIHYLCLAERPIYQEMFGWRPEDYPNATSIGRQTVSPPLSSGLSSFEIDTVVSAVRGVLVLTKLIDRAHLP